MMPALSLALERITEGIYQWTGLGPNILMAFSGREFTNARRGEFLGKLNISQDDFTHPHQVHGPEVLIVEDETAHYASRAADGMITHMERRALGIFTADCTPVFFANPLERIVGIAHAGWRGMREGIIEGMLKAFARHYHSAVSHLYVAIGPTIRKCCYEVGPEFRDYFGNHFTPETGGLGKGRMDLIGSVRERLLSGGVLPANLFDSGICTSCRNDDFFSYRREGGTQERMVSLIQLK